MVATSARGPARFAVPHFVVLWSSVLAACAGATTAMEMDPALAPYEGREIRRVVFVDPAPFSADTLARLIETEPTQCRFLGLPICIPLTDIGEREGRLDVGTVQRDARRLATFYRQSGFFGTRVLPAAEPVDEDGDEDVVVRFVIQRGDSVILDSLAVEGIEEVLPPDFPERLPLRVGELFDLGEFAASADTIRRELLVRGFAFAEVLRNFTADTVRDRAVASLVAVPGPRVEVDTIIVAGAEHLGRKATLRQLTFSQGDLLRADELVESQRNLYNLELVQFATVVIAPDSLQLAPRDSSRATVLVQVTEGPVHVVEAAVGFGTVVCFYTEARWISRSFRGGARRLALTGAVRKIGLGEPLKVGFGNSICNAFEGDPFADNLDYRLTADLTQPFFLSPRNQLTLSAFAERQSEPTVFQQEAWGGRLSVARRLSPREMLTWLLDIERSRTRARAALFCATFLVCRPADIRELEEPRWLNTVGLNWDRDRTDRLIDPTDGYQLRLGGAWAAPWLGSGVDFARGILEAARYAPFRPEHILATHLRAGSYVGAASLAPGDDYVPPEERFFAGGANSVRGFARNALGPGIYVGERPIFDPDEVDFAPIGGLGVVVANVEFRFPVGIMENLLRLAVFVDAGAVTRGQLGSLDGDDLRFTPGAGLRFRTPVGPVRLDAAYNPYAPLTAPLYLPDEETGALIRVLDNFTPERETFFGRFRFHLAVGQPF